MECSDLAARLAHGHVIPACPLALHADGAWSDQHQRALTRYYCDAGAGGLAVGVHSTQFAIRDPRHGLFRPVLELTAAESREWTNGRPPILIAGVCGDTAAAVEEAELAAALGYDAVLVSTTALAGRPDDDLVRHCATVAKTLPVVGFYLQPDVGGGVLPYSFWRKLASEVPRLVAIKIAPFNRYRTLDVIRAVADSGRRDIALYTGNDDNIVADLVTPFPGRSPDDPPLRIVGGLLGQWGVWTRGAVLMLDEIRTLRETGAAIDPELLRRGAALTDANAGIFDAPNHFAGCIPGILETLRLDGLVPSTRCLDPNESLSPGQSEEITGVRQAYPELQDPPEFLETNLPRWLA